MPVDKENQRRLARKWYEANKAKVRAAAKAWAESNPEKAKESRRNWIIRNLDAVKLKRKDYRKRNLDKRRIAQRRCRALKLDQYRAVKAAWHRKHLARGAAYAAKRRAVRIGSTVRPERINEFMEFVRRKRRIRCYYCREWVPGKEAHIDHVVALQGKTPGPHEVGNLCASCQPCNQSKWNKSISEWKKEGQMVLSL